MARYRSFLVRWWALQGGDQRIEIEEIQSGERAVVATVAAAIRWVDGRGARTDPAMPGQLPRKGGADEEPRSRRADDGNDENDGNGGDDEQGRNDATD